MSQKIRQGNDIDIHWSLLDADENPYILEGRNIEIELEVGKKRVKIRDILDVNQNTVHFVYYGKDQKYLGSYNLKFIENNGEVDMVTFDTMDAFTMVEHSWLAIDEGETPETIQLEFVTISSNIHSSVGPRGLPAGFGEITVSVDDTVGTPSADVIATGPDTAKNLHFDFSGLKGRDGTDGSDADVTQENIASALGYTPVAPADIADFITKAVNDLVNYYTKSETYTRSQIQELIAAIQGVQFVSVAERPTASADTMGGKIYLVPSADPQTQNVKDEYITLDNGAGAQTRYTWEQIGSTAVNLSGYVTTADLNGALADYTTTANLMTLLSGKQDVISDLATIRSGAAAGATAYQKPSSGIPSTDLADGVIPDVSGKQDVYSVPTAQIANPKEGDITVTAETTVNTHIEQSQATYKPTGFVLNDIGVLRITSTEYSIYMLPSLSKLRIYGYYQLYGSALLGTIEAETLQPFGQHIVVKDADGVAHEIAQNFPYDLSAIYQYGGNTVCSASIYFDEIIEEGQTSILTYIASINSVRPKQIYEYQKGAWHDRAAYTLAFDDVPTIGSDNLVKSGAIAKATQQHFKNDYTSQPTGMKEGDVWEYPAINNTIIGYNIGGFSMWSLNSALPTVVDVVQGTTEVSVTAYINGEQVVKDDVSEFPVTFPAGLTYISAREADLSSLVVTQSAPAGKKIYHSGSWVDIDAMFADPTALSNNDIDTIWTASMT